MSNMEVEKAKNYATPQTQQYITKMSAFGGKMGQDDDYSKIIIVQDSIDGDRAWVYYRTEKNPAISELEMIKMEGKWKANLKMKK